VPGAGLEVPQLVAAACIQREEVAFGIASKYQIAGSGEHGRE